ncbi:hypothetical protein [Citrobacter pasteurii]|nr:hypothetical protein SF123566_3907 [Shigella flexneri 1235-66]CEJ63866.1 hypothetical protein [Citrobacter pasteurii]
MLGSMQKLHDCGFFYNPGSPVFSQRPDNPAWVSDRNQWAEDPVNV